MMSGLMIKDSFVKSVELWLWMKRELILKLHSLTLHEAQHRAVCLLDILGTFLLLFCSLCIFFFFF